MAPPGEFFSSTLRLPVDLTEFRNVTASLLRDSEVPGALSSVVGRTVLAREFTASVPSESLCGTAPKRTAGPHLLVCSGRLADDSEDHAHGCLGQQYRGGLDLEEFRTADGRLVRLLDVVFLDDQDATRTIRPDAVRPSSQPCRITVSFLAVIEALLLVLERDLDVGLRRHLAVEGSGSVREAAGAAGDGALQHTGLVG